MPTTDYHLVEFNAMEQLFAGKVRIEKASGYYFYEKGSRYASLLHSLKYRNRSDIAFWIGEKYAKYLQSIGYFSDEDLIIPVPLHRIKHAQRGYNQSLKFAEGLSNITKIPIKNALYNVKRHSSQTMKGIYERWLNTQGVYQLKRNINLSEKHIILVDDVCTTGATLLACAKAIETQYPNVRISILTIAVAKEI